MGLEHFDTVLSFALVMLLLSLLITILVQAAVAVFGLRGNSLRWGLERLFQQLSPELNLKGRAKQLAQAVLTHPMLAHTGGRKATAIRREELLRVLDDLSRASGAERALETKKQLEVEVNAWFDTIMDRTTERFVLHTRWLTAVFAVILAVGLHIDSLQILRQLSTSSELRAKLVQGVDTALDKMGAVVTEAQKPQPLASLAIRGMKNDMGDAADKALLDKAPADLATRQAGEGWLRNNLAVSKLPAALAAYEKRFEEATVDRLKELGVSWDRIASSVDQTGLQIIPRPRPAYVADWKVWKTENANRRHILGTLMSALFLSLGAPFWFNALRQLANLRPILAGKVEKAKAEEKKEGEAS